MFVVADRVKETSTTNGTGNLDLDGASTGFQSFVGAIGTGNTTLYLITDNTDWEIGIGTITDGTPDTITRTTVLYSSNSNNLVNWAGGATKDIACVFPADGYIPSMRLFNNDSGSALGPTLNLIRRSESPADDDLLGHIDFIGKDDAGNDTIYARIHAKATDVSNTTEDGELVLSIMVNGTLTEMVSFDETGIVADISQVLPGTIIAYGGTGTPTGYLECNGQNVSRTTYADLFTAVSTTWGSGDGSTTFGVPNFQRRTLVGKGGSGTGTLGNAVGNTGGAETVNHSHTHTFSGSASTGTPSSTLPVDDSAGSPAPVGSSTHTHPVLISGTTGGASTVTFSVMQPSAVVGYFIKT